ncbi:MAG: FAD-dependent monooxygenase [Acidimicrobiia bacterium]|nr:FAD-dependent monooxygenase [Acidimicrobiia bacterium]
MPSTTNPSAKNPSTRVSDSRIDADRIDDHYDVVVVGARAAGAATAMLLARRGLRVLAVDRSAYGSDTLSTHSLAIAGVHQLSRWGVLDSIRESGTPVANAVRFHYGEDVVTLDVPARGDIDGLYSPRRTVLDSTLVDHAVASGADVRHGVSMVDVIRDETGRVTGVEIDVDHERRRVSADWVVGADGARSRVAAKVGAEVTYEEPTGAADIYSYWEGLPSDVIENFYAPGRAAGIIPTNDGAAVVWVGLTPEMFRDVARGNLAPTYHAMIGMFPELVERLRTATRVGGYRGFPGTPGFLREPSGPGWALVGDAGYFKDPVSAHGITDAFIGAELIADAIGDIIQCGVDERVALAEYALERDAMAAAMMPPVVAIAGLGSDMSLVQRSWKAMSAAMRDEYMMLTGRESARLAPAA